MFTRKIFFILFIALVSTGNVLANWPKPGEEVDLYGKYLIKVDISVNSHDLLPSKPGVQSTDVILYIADKSDVLYNPDEVGKTIYRVDFRVDGGTGLLIYQIMNYNLKEKLPINVTGRMDNGQIIRGEWVTDWPR